MRDVNLRRRKLLPRAAVFGALALVASTSIGLDSGDRRTPEMWARLPADIAKQVHFTTVELPGTPLEHDSLRDIRRWPPTMVFDGAVYRLATYRGHFDVGGPIDPKVPDPGAYYEAFYARPEDQRKRTGPHYLWLIDSTLVERSYRTPSGVQSFSYDAHGILRGFHSWDPHAPSRFSCDRRAHQASLQEWFDDHGQLVGAQAGGVSYWRGVARTRDDYSDIHVRWLNALPARGRPRRPALSPAESTWMKVPEELRSLIHVAMTELPALPRTGEALHDPRRWPATWKVDGNVYRRFYVEYRDERVREGLRSFRDIRSSVGYGAYYSPDGSRDYHVARGPFYTWASDGTLATREYRTDAAVHRWRYDSNGQLLLYRYRLKTQGAGWSCAGTSPIGQLVTEEWYSNDGALVGYISQVDHIAYWKGLPATPAVYADSLRHWIPNRDPRAWNAPHRL